MFLFSFTGKTIMKINTFLRTKDQQIREIGNSEYIVILLDPVNFFNLSDRIKKLDSESGSLIGWLLSSSWF